MRRQAPIALMTDFGVRDPFVGVMKGVILGINPAARIVDVCHEIDPGDVRSAAFALSMAFPYFPEGTVFAVVVDPGVGTSRRAVAAKLGGRTVVCPDNGVLTWVMKLHPAAASAELANAKFFLPSVSATFHGRDVFAPAAAHLSLGVPLTEFGPPIGQLTVFPVPGTSVTDGSIGGEIVYIDKFGNAVTNIARDEFESWRGETALNVVGVRVESAEVQGISETYGSAPRGCALAVFGSAGMLEIAINRGSAAQSLGLSIGSQVFVSRPAG